MQQPAKKITRSTYFAIGAVIVAAQAWVACGALEQRDTPHTAAIELGELPAQRVALELLQECRSLVHSLAA